MESTMAGTAEDTDKPTERCAHRIHPRPNCRSFHASFPVRGALAVLRTTQFVSLFCLSSTTMACDANFHIRGSIRYVPNVSSAPLQPAILCQGRYWSSPFLFDGRPYITRDKDAASLLLFCG